MTFWSVFLVLGLISGVRLSNVLNVPDDVMSFIMGCDGRFSEGEAPKISTKKIETDPETGVQTETISMATISELRRSLEDSVENDQIISRILNQVEDNLRARQISTTPERSSQCMNVHIDVPHQEVKGLQEHLQAVVQQNNYQLLEQINTLFSFKLNSFYREFEESLKKHLAELATGLAHFQKSQQEGTKAGGSEQSPGPEASVGETRVFQGGVQAKSEPSSSMPREENIEINEEVVQSEGITKGVEEEVSAVADYPEYESGPVAEPESGPTASETETKAELEPELVELESVDPEPEQAPLNQTSSGPSDISLAEEDTEAKEPEKEIEKVVSSTRKRFEMRRRLRARGQKREEVEELEKETPVKAEPEVSEIVPQEAIAEEEAEKDPAPELEVTEEEADPSPPSRRTTFKRRRPDPRSSHKRRISPRVGKPAPDIDTAIEDEEPVEEEIKGINAPSGEGRRSSKGEEIRQRRKEILERLRKG